ncbi:MAG: aspartyl protease family protein [Cryomorphaceae bacterium]
MNIQFRKRTDALRSAKTIFKLAFFALVLIILSGCQAMKVHRLMRSGEAQQKSFYASVPFEFRAGVPILEAEVNGIKGQFLFDTGAPNVISQEFAERLKLKTKAKGGVRDSGGNYQSRQVYLEIDSIKIGGVSFKKTGAVVQDLQSSDIFKCLDFDGIVGANLMRQAYWKINYTEETISFSSDLADLELDSTYRSMHFSPLFTGTPVVSLDLNGISLTRILFDTGSNKGFSLPLRYLRQMEDSATVETTWEFGSTSYGVGGKSQADTIFHALIDTLNFCGYSLPHTAVAFDENAYTIGNEFLSHYHVILDWESNKIYLQEDSPYDYSELKTLGFGVDLTEGQIKVGSIFAGSQAAEKLKADDQILRIDEYNFDPAPEGLICQLTNNRDLQFTERDSIDITVKRGEEVLSFKLEQVRLLPKE